MNNKNDTAKKFGASINFDSFLYKFDIIGSLIHIKGLYKCGVLTHSELKIISNGLKSILKKIDNNNIKFELSDEDIHMNIEKILCKEIGNELAGKLHTGRSRNDQIALDLHLYLRQEILNIIEKIRLVQMSIIIQAENNIDVILPGYTHLQRAIPIRLSHHLLSYFFMFQRDIEKFINNWQEINIMPLGSGALAGSGYDIDRNYMSKLLKFQNIYDNSMDAVSNRDFIINFLFCSSMLMMHLSRMSEELIIWNSQEFNFVNLHSDHCTGSSMMPQKNNPDILELIRGKTGRVYGSLMGILTVFKSLPMTYNKDMQEDKEGLIDTLNTITKSLNIFKDIIKLAQFNANNMQQATINGFMESTQIANYLVSKGMPFRLAYDKVKEIIHYCIKNNKKFKDLSIEEYNKISPLIDNAIYSKIDIKSIVESYISEGGTSIKSVKKQIEKAKVQIENTKNFVSNKSIKINIKI